MKPLDPETEQFLLGRPVRSGLTDAQCHAFNGRRILITGAGGSVGAELARQIAACGPRDLVLLDHAEYALFTIARELEDKHPSTPIVSVLGDVSRRKDITTACRLHRPQYVFHAAACKHVTIAEQCIVPAVRTNVIGAVFTANAARDAGARFVLISSDKAAAPRSVMGASKRMAELLVLGAPSGPGSIAVRFGNVLGSSGSVVEVLMDAARSGKRLTVTDPDATRFFMTAAEAASLVLKAAVSGESGEVFWLDMGQPLRLGDLVDRVLDAATPAGHERSAISIIGLRPGEKRHEELTSQGLEMHATADAAIWRARQAPIDSSITLLLARARHACAAGDAADALRAVRAAVPDYVPSPQARAAAIRQQVALRADRGPRKAGAGAATLVPWRKRA